jgi:hypothetical protein
MEVIDILGPPSRQTPGGEKCRGNLAKSPAGYASVGTPDQLALLVCVWLNPQASLTPLAIYLAKSDRAKPIVRAKNMGEAISSVFYKRPRRSVRRRGCGVVEFSGVVLHHV